MEQVQHRKRKKLARVLGGKNGSRKSVARKQRRYTGKVRGGIVSACIAPKELKEIARLCKKWDLNMSQAVRVLILIGLRDKHEWSAPMDALGGLGIFR